MVTRPGPLDRLHALLDEVDGATSNTSMRLPTALRDAAELAVREFGAAPSATALTVGALRDRVEAVAVQAALDEHYRRHPDARPSLGELAIVAAELDGHPLAARPEVLQRAADEVLAVRPDADADDVLLWAEARSLGTAS